MASISYGEIDDRDSGLPASPGPTTVQSVSRAIRLLMLVASGTTGTTGKELAQAAGLATPTAHHLLSTLVHEGLLTKGSAARYQLGPNVAVLYEAVQREVVTPEYLVGPLHTLSATTGETAYVAAWRQGEIWLLAVVEGRQPVRVSVPVVRPYTDAHARATGKLLLATASEEVRGAYMIAHPPRPVTPHTIVDVNRLNGEFESIRTNGYAIDEEEFQPGVCCVSAPVIAEGVVIAVYTISVPSQRFNDKRAWLIDAVMTVAGGLEFSPSGVSVAH